MTRITITMQNGTKLQLTWGLPNRDPGSDVEVVQNGQFGGYYTDAQAQAGLAKCRAQGLEIVEETI